MRQHPIFFKNVSGKECFYIADFYCHECKLVIEIDGKSHDKQREYDTARTEIIEAIDITVIRFQNEEIENDLTSVLEKIKDILGS